VIPEPVDVPNKLSHGLGGSSNDLYHLQQQQMMMNNGNVDPNGLSKEGTRLAGYIGAYSPEQRKLRIEKFLAKRSRRVWTRKVKYDVRKNFADSRLRIKVKFILFSFLCFD
jgi:hypothetical protein